MGSILCLYIIKKTTVTYIEKNLNQFNTLTLRFNNYMD